VAASETPIKVAMLPGVIDMETGFIAWTFVSNPFSIVMNVRSFGVTLVVPKRLWGWSGGRTAGRRRTVFGDVTSTHRMTSTTTFAVLPMLRYCG